jgi:hypothetical protein
MHPSWTWTWKAAILTIGDAPLQVLESVARHSNALIPIRSGCIALDSQLHGSRLRHLNYWNSARVDLRANLHWAEVRASRSCALDRRYSLS